VKYSTIRVAACAALALISGSAASVHAQALTGLPVMTQGVVAANPEADTATSEFAVDGLRVILRRNTATDVVAANLFLLGGAQQLTPATQGIEAFLLAASERGTLHYSTEALRRKMNVLGSTIVIDPSDDWTVFGLRALRSTFDSTWALFADRLMNPKLDPADVEIVREQLLTGIRQQRLHPDAALRLLADSLMYQGHPYALSTQGTESSISQTSVNALRDYQSKQFVTSRMLLVVVGNVERARVEGLVRGTLGRLPAGNYKWTPPAPIAKQSRA
jgi:zinc protease